LLPVANVSLGYQFYQGGKNMNISVTFRAGEGENWQKTYAEERIAKLKSISMCLPKSI